MNERELNTLFNIVTEPDKNAYAIDTEQTKAVKFKEL